MMKMLYSILVFVFCSFLFLLISVGGSEMQCGKCPKDFTHHKNEQKCYKAFTTRKTWDEAQKTCYELNSHLVIINDNMTNDLVKKVVYLLKEKCKCDLAEFWTSGRRVCKNETFAWNPHQGLQVKLKLDNWLPGEPNNRYGIEEDCLAVVMVNYELFGFNDAPCLDEHCFICEIDIWK